jgi:DNA-binding transcriptional LysR family regulator
MPPISHNGLSIQEIYHVPRVAVISAGHRLAGRATISVHELFDDPWIVAETSDTVCRDFWLAAGHRAGLPAKLGQATKTIDKFIQLAIAGQVVGLAAAWVERTFGRPGLRFIPVVDIEPAVTAVAWHPTSVTPLAKRFLAIAAYRGPLPARPAS